MFKKMFKSFVQFISYAKMCGNAWNLGLHFGIPRSMDLLDIFHFLSFLKMKLY
jgi:hypothetical protein